MFKKGTVAALRSTWAQVSPDAGPTTKLEAAELTLDRLTGNVSETIDLLCAEYGYHKVKAATAKIL